jgi:hypothetical protein
MEESTSRGNFFHQNELDSDLESNRGVCIETPGTIYVCPSTDPRAALLQIISTDFNLNRKTHNYVLQQCVGAATELCLYTSSVFNYVQIPLYIWYIVH